MQRTAISDFQQTAVPLQAHCAGPRLIKIENITLNIQPQRLVKDTERINGFSACVKGYDNWSGQNTPCTSPNQTFRSSITANIALSPFASFPVTRPFVDQSGALASDPIRRSASGRSTNTWSNVFTNEGPGRPAFKITRYIAPTSTLLSQQTNPYAAPRQIEPWVPCYYEDIGANSTFPAHKNWNILTGPERQLGFLSSQLHRQVSDPVSGEFRRPVSSTHLPDIPPPPSWPYPIAQRHCGSFMQMNSQPDHEICTRGTPRATHHYPRSTYRILSVNTPRSNPLSGSVDSSLLGAHSATFHDQPTADSKPADIFNEQTPRIPDHTSAVSSGAQNYKHFVLGMMSDSALTNSCSSSGIDLRSHANSLASRSSSPTNEEASTDSHDARDKGNLLAITPHADSASSDEKSCSIFPERSTQSTPLSNFRQPTQEVSALLNRRKDLLRDIAQEYSRLLQLMNEERILTGNDPKGYNDTVRDYEAAMDEFEIVSMYNARSSSHPESKGSEPPSTVMRTAYPLPMGTLSRISVGSLQNLNLLGGDTKKEAADSAVPCRHSSFKDRAGNAPLEGLPPRNSAHGRTSVGLRSSHGLDQRPSLRKWFSLKGLNGSMTVPSSSRKEAYSPKVSVCRRIYSDTVSPAEKPELNLSELDDLIAWKEVEVKTVENILAENRSLSTDRSRSRKARLAYNSSAEENAAKLTTLMQEVAELKAKRGFALAVKTKTDMNAKATEAPIAKTSCVSSVCDDADTFAVRPCLPKRSEDVKRPSIGINMEKYTPVTPRPSEPSCGVVVSDARPQASRTDDHLIQLAYHGNNGNNATNEAKEKNISTYEQSRTVKNQSPIPSIRRDWDLDGELAAYSSKMQRPSCWRLVQPSFPELSPMPNRISEQQGTLLQNNATHYSQLSSLDSITPSGMLPRTPYMEDDAFQSPTPTSCYYNLRSATSYQDVFSVQRSSTTGTRNSPVLTTPSFQKPSSISNRPNYQPRRGLQTRPLSTSPQAYSSSEWANGPSTCNTPVRNNQTFKVDHDRKAYPLVQGNAASLYQSAGLARTNLVPATVKIDDQRSRCNQERMTGTQPAVSFASVHGKPFTLADKLNMSASTLN